jgi:TolB protein
MTRYSYRRRATGGWMGALAVGAAALALGLVVVEGGAQTSRPAAAPGTGAARPDSSANPAGAAADRADEPHLKNIRQLTFGGENAEAYWSPDGTKLVLQSTRPPYDCDQIFVLDPATGASTLVSTGKGRTTCAYFLPDNRTVLYASTHLGGEACPPPPSFEQGYVWALYPSYDIVTATLDGSIVKRLTDAPGYDAEATIAPDGSRIVFTSDRDGDLELYTMALDGSDVKRLTHTPGYDGGAFFSPDSKLLCYRAHHPTEPAELAEYRDLLARHLIKPGVLDLMVMNADGTEPRVVLSNGAANFAPYFHPSGTKLIFSSNLGDPKGRNFDLYLVNLDGTGLVRVTSNDTFDGFPMFSPDGTKLVFASNRNAKARGETNIFIADWVE